MRLTTRTNLAMRVLMYCAVNPDGLNRTIDIAHAVNASVNHLMQVVPALHRHGFVQTTRGRAGGVRLARPAAAISVGQVFRLFESGVPFAECFEGAENTCPLTEHCRLRPAIRRALDAFYCELDSVSVAELTEGNCGLDALLNGTTALAPSCHGPSTARHDGAYLPS